MKNWIKGVTIVAALSLGSVAAAQPAGPGGRPPMGPPRGPQAGPPLERALDLTSEQQTAVKALRDEERKTLQPLFEQLGTLHDNLRQALESGAPDASAVGQLVISAHGVQQQMKSTQESFHDRFVALLTPEQQQKLELLESMRPPRGPGGPGGPGRGPGPGFGR